MRYAQQVRQEQLDALRDRLADRPEPKAVHLDELTPTELVDLEATCVETIMAIQAMAQT